MQPLRRMVPSFGWEISPVRGRFRRGCELEPRSSQITTPGPQMARMTNHYQNPGRGTIRAHCGSPDSPRCVHFAIPACKASSQPHPCNGPCGCTRYRCKVSAGGIAGTRLVSRFIAPTDTPEAHKSPIAPTTQPATTCPMALTFRQQAAPGGRSSC